MGGWGGGRRKRKEEEEEMEEEEIEEEEEERSFVRLLWRKNTSTLYSKFSPTHPPTHP